MELILFHQGRDDHHETNFSANQASTSIGLSKQPSSHANIQQRYVYGNGRLYFGVHRLPRFSRRGLPRNPFDRHQPSQVTPITLLVAPLRKFSPVTPSSIASPPQKIKCFLRNCWHFLYNLKKTLSSVNPSGFSGNPQLPQKPF